MDSETSKEITKIIKIYGHRTNTYSLKSVPKYIAKSIDTFDYESYEFLLCLMKN